MAAQVSIPLSLPRDPEAQRRELERMTAALSTYFAGFTGQPHAGTVARRYKKRPLNDTKAAFWEITPVALPNSTDELVIALPPPDPRNAGLKLIVARQTTTGTIVLSAAGCLINGQKTVEVVNELGFVEGLFDGENYLTPPGTTSWEEA